MQFMNRNLLLKSWYIFVIVMGINTITACSEKYPIEEVAQETNVLKYTTTQADTRSLSEILELAGLSRRNTRSQSLPEAIMPVVDHSDTVAYIVNYANSEGFVIISTNKKVEPLLAYSDTGSFSLDNEMAKCYFVDKIKSYSDNVHPMDADLKESFAAASLDTIHYKYEPVIKKSLGQWSPYNKVVEKYYPACPAGCGPVAAAMIMSYCKPSLLMDNCVYQFSWINEALIVGPEYNGIKDPGIIPNVINISRPTSWIMNYNGAVSAISQLLYDIGKRMKARYTPKSTDAYLSDARAAIISAGYDVSSITSFDTDNMIDNMKNGYLYYQHGMRTSDKGHFGVIDGFEYDCLDNGEKVNCYFYCHWGWDGSCDGYYRSDMFKPLADYHYSAGNNFYVRIEE